MTKTKELKNPELFFNRELSWLKFNERVLEQALDSNLPLLERLKFASIFASNLDEFFMIRVAGLKQQYQAGIRKKDPSGLTPKKQLTEISHSTHKLTERHTKTVSSILKQLSDCGLNILKYKDCGSEDRQWLKKYFTTSIMPVLTLLAIADKDKMTFLPGKQLNIIITLEKQNANSGSNEKDKQQCNHIIIPMPSLCERFVRLPNYEERSFVLLEDIIAENCGILLGEKEIKSVDIFRLTRDADVDIQDDEASDLLEVVEKAVQSRRHRNPTRLEIQGTPSKELEKFLIQQFDFDKEDIYNINGFMAASDLMSLCFLPQFDKLKTSEWHSQPSIDLSESTDIWKTLQKKDVMLMHPYESFSPVIDFLEKAAEDNNVLAIKQTLYRTSSDSPIIKALERAAENGKQVTVLVELKARFDEARNVQWAKRLEKAGCYVVYGVSNLKTHSKALLVIRRQKESIVQYAHLGTGNYNEKTAKLYSDIAVMTSNKEITKDVSAFFNLLTGISETVGWSKLSVAPVLLKKKIIEQINQEISVSSKNKKGLIMIKVNSLQDPEIIKALYKASQNNVKVKLNIRGICCLRPGIKGVSDNIEVVSIVDKFLEHSRIYYFQNLTSPNIYLSSADLMTRNLDKRLEILFPVMAREHKKRITKTLNLYFNDNCSTHRMLPSGEYQKKRNSNEKIRAQEQLYQYFVEVSKSLVKNFERFKPLKQF